MICPRCDQDNVELMVKAPVDDAWEVYLCKTCFFSWRSTEDDLIQEPKKYDKRFKINSEQISSLPSIPPIPKAMEKVK